MATYNGARFIREQLDSLNRQTKLPCELVVTDDNSTDETLAIIEEFSKTAKFPVHIHKNPERLGFKANFMKACGLCAGDYIALCDQDDVWRAHKLETVMHSFGPDVLLVYSNAIITDEKLTRTGTMRHNAPKKYLNPPQTLQPWMYNAGLTCVYHHSLVEYNDLWEKSVSFTYDNEREAHDQWLYFLASTLGTIIYLPEELLYYRQHGKNTFGWKKTGHWRDSWNRFISPGIDDLERHALSAQRRAQALFAILDREYGPKRPLIERAAIRYNLLAQSYRKRVDFYRTGNPASRLFKLLQMVISGVYRPKSALGAGYLGIIRDFVRGVIFRPSIHA